MNIEQAKKIAQGLSRCAGQLEGEILAAERDKKGDVDAEQVLRHVRELVGENQPRN